MPAAKRNTPWRISRRVKKSKFDYEYDFGDGWIHNVTVEKIFAPDPTFKHPVCLDSKNACPPEDCGGIGGYYDMLGKLADPKNPERDEVLEWLGEEWDAGHFDLNRVNTSLKRIRV